MPTRRTLTLALGDYDINRALITGEVAPQGLDLTVITLSSPERHARMVRHDEFDVCELSLATLLALHGTGRRDLVAIPAFPHRRFRHGFAFVRGDGNITRPEELGGRRIGLRTWQTTAGLWLRGILQDDHGLDLRSVEWVTQDDEDVPMAAGSGFRIRRAGSGSDVVAMLRGGELDALIYPEAPPGLGAQGSPLRRLFADPKAAEIDYHRRTGIFPPMHAVVVRRELVEELPWLARELLEAFRRSKDRAFAAMRDPRRVSLAWLREALAEQEAILGPDPWAYDFSPTAPALATLVRYAHEQALVGDVFPPAELFAPSTLEDLPSYI